MVSFVYSCVFAFLCPARSHRQKFRQESGQKAFSAIPGNTQQFLRVSLGSAGSTRRAFPVYWLKGESPAWPFYLSKPPLCVYNKSCNKKRPVLSRCGGTGQAQRRRGKCPLTLSICLPGWGGLARAVPVCRRFASGQPTS